MDLGLKDKVAFVAGSSRGIGRAIARGFLAEGARVVISGRGKEAVEATVREFQKEFGAEAVLGQSGDLTDPAVIKTSMERVHARWGRIDAVVSNIGSGNSVPGWHVDPGEWTRVFNLNLFGTVALVNEAMPRFIEQKQGSIVLIGSIAGIEATNAPVVDGGWTTT